MPPGIKSTPCIHCRQMKLKCDVKARFPSPCSRCEKFKLRCSVDPSFKRTAKRDRLEKVEKELLDIKRRLGSKERDTSPTIPENSSKSDTSQTITTDIESILLHSEVEFNNMSLEDTTLDLSAIHLLLKEYYTYYHPLFPIAPELPHLLQCYLSQLPLFWTIITIASKTTKQHPSIYLALSSAIPKLIEKILHSNGKELWMIQALLLLCCWPLPFGPKSADPSLLYSGLATSSALEIGLHRYKFPSDFTYDEPYDEDRAFMQKKTWLACFIVSQHLSAELGVPTCFHIDRTIISALETSDIRMPGVLRDQLRTAYLGFKISNSLGNDILSFSGLSSNRMPLIHLFETDLATARTVNADDMDTSGEICFLAVSLQLYSYALEHNIGEGKENAGDSGRCEILLRGYNAAMELVQIAVTNSSEAPYWTRQIYQSVIHAITFLLKLCSSSAPQLSVIDSPSTRNLISQGWDFLRSGSLMENDHLFRISTLVAYLSKLEGKDPQLPRLSVQSRMSANVMYDAVWRAKQRFSPEVRNMRPADYTTTAVLEELSASWAENVLNEDGLFRHWNSVITNF